MVFCSHAKISLWFFTVFFQFFGSDFFLNSFPNPFIAHSRPSCLCEPNFDFSLLVFLFTCGILALIFCFFKYFYLICLKMVFPIHSLSVLGLVFLFCQLSVVRVFFCSFAWLNFWSHLTYLTLKMTYSLWNWLLFTFFQRDKVKSVCVTLNEGYWRAAKRQQKLIQIFNQNVTYQPSMKRRNFLVCLFLFFFETADKRSYCGYFLAICQLWGAK